MAIKINRTELFRWAGFIGAMLLAGGYLRYSVQEVLGTIEKSLLISGAVLLVLALAFNFRLVREVFTRRSAKLGTNTVVMTLAVVAILGIVNFLGSRHHKRIDLTAEGLYSLSDQTRKIVSDLNRDVRVILFDKQDDATLADRMKEYRELSSRLTYERIDPQARPQVARQHSITRNGEIVVVAGDRTERPQETTEQALTNAILKVTRDRLKKICFVTGHGEKQIDATGEGEGYGVVNQWLKDENYETASVNLVASNQVPSDCDVLVLAGPKQPLFPQEVTMIGKYLESGGKALVMIDPETDPGLGDVLRQWNIQLGNDTVLDVSGVGRLFGTGPGVPLARTYGSHPITKDFQNSMTFFPLARSVSVVPGSGAGPLTTELLKTSEESWAETELESGEARFDEGKDKKGPVTIGVAASQGVGEAEARLVVIGDSDFATNAYVQLQRNGDLFMNSINWLAQDEELISIRPKSPTNRRVTMTSSQQNMLFWLVIIFLPGAVIGSGVYIWWKRR